MQIFVANPDKSTEVRRILVSNRQALVEFIGALLPEKGRAGERSGE